MKMVSFILFAFFSIVAFSASAKQTSLIAPQKDTTQIIVNNRVLVKVNGKPITVIDVMKKMDMLFYRQYPEYVSIPSARYQFYEANWKHFLQEMIDKELILAEATEKNITASKGDVRQEMETLFGPNIIGNLQKIGLSYDDASKMIQDELIIRKILQYRAHVKAIQKVTPALIQEEYKKYAEENVRSEQWNYNVIAVRHPESEDAKAFADALYSELSTASAKWEQVPNIVKKIEDKGSTAKVTLSDEFQLSEKEISPAYLEALSSLGAETYSHPIAQKSRSDRTIVYRILYLKSHNTAGAPPFPQVEAELRNRLIDQAVEDESANYMQRLRERFHIDEEHLQEEIPENFQPFILKQ